LKSIGKETRTEKHLKTPPKNNRQVHTRPERMW